MDKFSIQMNICVLKKNILLKIYFHLKEDKNCIGGPCIKNPFYTFIKTLDEIEEKLPPKYTKTYPKNSTFYYLKHPPPPP
jgi:hypothetical protein